MVNLRFNFKMDLADISTIDFAFAKTYADLETNPFLEKSYPEEGTYSQRAIILELTVEEAELLPEQFYALATVNFKNGETIKAHAFKNTAKEEALSAALALEDTEFNINFFIDEVSGGGGGVDAYINGVKLEGYKTAAQLDLVQASENIKIWEAVFDDNDEISTDVADYPGIKKEDVAIYMTPYSQVKMWMQPMNPSEDTVHWVPVDIDEVRYTKGVGEPPVTCTYQEGHRYDIGQIYLQNEGEGLYILVKQEFISTDSGYKLFWKEIKTSNHHNIFDALYDDNNELKTNFTDYQGMQLGDFIIDTNYKNEEWALPNMIWCVTKGNDPSQEHFKPIPIVIKQKYCDGEPITSDVVFKPYQINDIVYSTNQKIYKCINVTPAEQGFVNYEWEEQIFIPKPTAADAGKVLQVNSNGQPEWVTL